MTITTTPRLTLAPHTVDGAERILRGEPGETDRWAAGYPFADELAILPGFIDGFRTDGDPAPFGPYVIRRNADGLAIGGIGFTGPPDAAGAVEVGYGLIAPARGRGYATEALAAVTETARANGALIVRADTAPTTLASQNVLLKVGFVELSRTLDAVFFELML